MGIDHICLIMGRAVHRDFKSVVPNDVSAAEFRADVVPHVTISARVVILEQVVLDEDEVLITKMERIAARVLFINPTVGSPAVIFAVPTVPHLYAIRAIVDIVARIGVVHRVVVQYPIEATPRTRLKHRYDRVRRDVIQVVIIDSK